MQVMLGQGRASDSSNFDELPISLLCPCLREDLMHLNALALSRAASPALQASATLVGMAASTMLATVARRILA